MSCNDSIHIAHEVLSYSSDKIKFDTQKLIKIIYIAHAYMLVLYDKPLFFDDIEAWEYGPMIPLLYDKLKNYKLDILESETLKDNIKVYSLTPDNIDIIEQIVDKYGMLSGKELSTITHLKDSPWDISHKNGELVINEDYIRLYYSGVKLGSDI